MVAPGCVWVIEGVEHEAAPGDGRVDGVLEAVVDRDAIIGDEAVQQKRPQLGDP